MKKSILSLLFVFALLFTACDSEQSTQSETPATPTTSEEVVASAAKAEILVAAASSLTDVTAELSQKFNETNPYITINFTYGGSGALQTQIEEGAPVDIFMSASNKQMVALKEKGLLINDSIVELLENKIVLIKPMGNDLDITSFEDCATDKVQLIAMGNYDSTPIGEYTKEIFTNLGIIDQVTAKGNFATDVRQVLTWVEMGEVDCGVVYATDAAMSDKSEVICEAPEGSHSPVIYPAAIIKTTENLEASQKFLNFLSSDDAKVIFEKYGFTTI